MNNDLKWLAENVHEWPKNVSHKSQCKVSTHGSWRVDNAIHQWVFISYDVVKYTRAQWQAARDELSGNSNEDSAMNQVTLKPGDYCDVRNTTTEQRKSIADAFISAGANKGACYPYVRHMEILGWHYGNQTHGTKRGASTDTFTRLLTIDQVLNATNTRSEHSVAHVTNPGDLDKELELYTQEYTFDVSQMRVPRKHGDEPRYTPLGNGHNAGLAPAKEHVMTLEEICNEIDECEFEYNSISSREGISQGLRSAIKQGIIERKSELETRVRKLGFLNKEVA